MQELEFHPIANIFPLLPDAELEELASDIKKNGLAQSIILHQGKILDGRNRFKACGIAGVVPKTQEFNNCDPLTFVVSMNLQRRHLDYDQRVGVALKIRKLKPKGRPPENGTKSSHLSERSAEVAAKACKVGQTAVKEAAAEEKENPSVADDLISGKDTMKSVRKRARKRKQAKKQKEAEAKVKSIPQTWNVTDSQAATKCSAVITDPPYGILDEPWEPKKLKTFTVDWLQRWSKCGADTFLIFWSQRYLWDGKKWFDGALPKYEFQQLLVWNYKNNKSPQSRMGFKQTWEPVFFYRRKGSERKIQVAGSAWGNDLHDFDCFDFAVPQSNFNGQNMKQHPAQKPVEVFRWLINAVTEPGELVCDPFCGSGTSGIASTQLKRPYHGIEIDPNFVQLAKERIALYGQGI